MLPAAGCLAGACTGYPGYVAVQANISFYRGEDVVLTITELPVPTSIAGWTISFTVRQSQGGVVLISKTIGSGITITDAANGVFTVTISASDTSGLQPGLYLFDVQRTNSGFETVLTIGQLQLVPEVLV